MTEHVIHVERPAFDGQGVIRYFQVVCACGWRSTPSYNRRWQWMVGTGHLTRARDERLKTALLLAGERDEKVDVKAWYEANPIPEVPL
jgi:hypothetical protein